METEENEESQRFAPGSMDDVLSGIDSPEIRERILRIAHEAGVRPEDPLWVIIVLILKAQEAKSWAGKAAEAAGTAADSVRNAIEALPARIKSSVGDAGGDLRQTIRAAGDDSAKSIMTAGVEIGKALIDAIRKESSGFEKNLLKISEKKKDEVVNGWLKSLSEAARAHQTVNRTKWFVFGLLSALVFLAAGAGAGWYYMSGKLDQLRLLATEKIRQVESESGGTVSLSCNRPGEKTFTDKTGARYCYRLIPMN